KPLHQTRATTDVLLDVGRQLEKPIALPWQTFDEMLTASFAALPAMTEGSDAWTDAQEKGGWWGELPEKVRLKPPASAYSASERCAIRRRCGSVSVSLSAVSIEPVPRWIDRASAVAAGDAGPDDVGDVE